RGGGDAGVLGVLLRALQLALVGLEQAAHDDEEDRHEEHRQRGAHHNAAHHPGADGALTGLGVLPLAIASGASSASQRAIGTGVMGGIVVGTTLAVFFVPIFFVVVRSLFKPNQRELERSQQHAEHAGITAASADAYVAAAEQGMSEAERQALHQGAQPPLTKDPS
ncbi:MAG: hypothetical protein E6Q65_01380, partial [Ottowia sp.]